MKARDYPPIFQGICTEKSLHIYCIHDKYKQDRFLKEYANFVHCNGCKHLEKVRSRFLKRKFLVHSN
jgi:hypothetical protein